MAELFKGDLALPINIFRLGTFRRDVQESINIRQATEVARRRLVNSGVDLGPGDRFFLIRANFADPKYMAKCLSYQDSIDHAAVRYLSTGSLQKVLSGLDKMVQIKNSLARVLRVAA